MRAVGVILLCVIATSLSDPDPEQRRVYPPVGGAGGLLGTLLGVPFIPLVGRSDLESADIEDPNFGNEVESDLGRQRRPRPTLGRPLRLRPRPVLVARPQPVDPLLGSLVGLGLLNALTPRSDLQTSDVEGRYSEIENEEGRGRVLVRRPVYQRVRVVRPRPGLLGGYRRPGIGGLFGNLLALGLGASLLGGLVGRSDLPTADLEGAYSDDLVEDIIAREVEAAVEAGEDIDRNEDGKIDRNEFHWTFPELDLYEEFGKLDTDNSGFIEQHEVEDHTLERRIPASEVPFCTNGINCSCCPECCQ